MNKYSNAMKSDQFVDKFFLLLILFEGESKVTVSVIYICDCQVIQNWLIHFYTE